MTAWKRERPDERDHVGPLYITTANCVAAVGRPWRQTLELAQRHGCEILQIGRVRHILASDLQRALRAEAAEHAAQQPPLTEDQEAAELLREMGLALRQ
jgi:hypothetical protein